MQLSQAAEVHQAPVRSGRSHAGAVPDSLPQTPIPDKEDARKLLPQAQSTRSANMSNDGTVAPPGAQAAPFFPLPRDEWLAQWHEPVIEPDLPIIDPHHHLWDRPDWRYVGDELLADLECGHKVLTTVFAQCRERYRPDGPVALKPLGETEFVVQVAHALEVRRGSARSVCAGIVGHADLTLGAQVRAVLEAQVRAAEGRFRGIRHAAAFDADPALALTMPRVSAGLLRDARFRAGFTCLADLDLSFDAWVYHPQLGDVLALAQAFPETSIVLDHLGGPLGIGAYATRRDAVFAEWRAAILALAACPNVSVKLGGLGMRLCGFGFCDQPHPPTSEQLAGAWRPWVETCIEAFGSQRCMFESNFPVDRGSCSYAVLWNAFKRLAAGYSAADKGLLFAGTAARVYRLGPIENLPLPRPAVF